MLKVISLSVRTESACGGMNRQTEPTGLYDLIQQVHRIHGWMDSRWMDGWMDEL